MKSVLCKAWGPPDSLVVEELPSPAPKPGEIVVSVRAAGVNFPDTLIIEGKYQFKPEFPFAPGGEFAGVVKALGEGVTQFTVGQPVAALTTWGAFAEEVAIDARKVVPLPPGTDFALAAAFGLTYGTSFHALKDRANLQAGETMLVLGAAGGVGLAAVELGKLMGARVIAAASTDDKLATCKRYGADETINYETEDLRERIKALTGGKGVDVVYDPVGGKFSELAVRSLAWKGRHLVVGFANGEIPKIPLNLALLKGAAIVGVFWGAFTQSEPKLNAANIAQLMRWVGEGKLKPLVSARYPLAKAAQALKDLTARKAQGKIVLVTA
jgi:NADPH:quinone reductase